MNSRDRASRKGPYPYYGASGVVDYVDSYLFEGRHILVAEDGENLRSRKTPVSFFADGRFWVNNHAHIVKAKPGIADDYFVMMSIEHTDISGFITGAAQPKLTQQNLRLIAIACPPLEVQRRIADILSAYDDLIDNNTKRIKILEEMAQSLYRQWLVSCAVPGLGVERKPSPSGPIPKGWRAMPLSEGIAIDPRTAVPVDGEKSFVPMGSLSTNSMLIEPVETRSGNSGSKFKNGDTLFARITPCLENGKTGFVQFLPDEESVAFGSTEFIVMRSRELTPEMTYLLARSESFRSHAIKSMSGATGRQRVQQKCFDSFLVAIPPRDVAARFTEIVRPMFRSVHQLAEANSLLRQTRDLLLPRLLSGEIDVTKLRDADVTPDLAAHIETASPTIESPHAAPRSPTQYRGWGRDERNGTPASRRVALPAGGGSSRR